MFFGSRLNRLATSIRRGISKYSVGSDNPGLVFDFIDNFYQKDKNQTVNFDGAITHSRSGNAVMTDGYGPELVTNGGFDSDSDWSISPSGSAEISNSVLFVDGVTSTVTQNNLGTEDNKMYVVEFDYTFQGTATTGTRAYIRLGEVSGQKSLNGAHPNQTKRISLLMQAGSGNYLALVPVVSSGESITIDNVSVREMPVIKWAPHNLLSYSEEFDQWGLGSSSTLTANYASAPNGEQTAYRVQFPTSAGTFINANMSGKQQGGSYTFAVFVKATSGTSDFGLYSDIAGSQTTSATLTATSEWQLFEFTAIAGASGVTWGINNGNDSYASDILIWGAHVYRSDLGGMVDNPDQPLSRASYVPTTSSAKYLPRIGHHVYNGSAWVNEGLLAESEARTNLIWYSDFFNNSAWVKGGASVVADNAISPDGTQNAEKLVSDTSTSFHYAGQGASGSSGTYTASCYIKAAGYNYGGIRLVNDSFGSNRFSVLIDLTDGSFVDSETIGSPSVSDFTVEDAGNGWFRLSVSLNHSTGALNLSIFMNDDDSPTWASGIGMTTFTGDGTSGIYIYGAQLESGSTPSSLIPTSGSTVTRPAETFTIPSANLPWPEPNYIGSELVTNGTFDTDLNGWTEQNQTTATVVNGEVQVTGDGGYDDRINQTISTEVGKVYKVTATLRKISASARIGIRRASSPFSDITASTVSSTSNTDVELFFVADQTSFNVQLYSYTAGAGTAAFDNISVREIDPLSVSIAMDGRMTYADTGVNAEAQLSRWYDSSNDYLLIRLDTTTSRTGQMDFIQREGGTTDTVESATKEYSAGILTPFDVSMRSGSTFLNGATDGVALTANTTPTALPDLSATDLLLAHDYMGTIGTFRVWDRDIGDDGLVEATNPSLEPSLSLTFEGTGTNSFVVNNWSE